MSFQDILLHCSGCGAAFAISAEKQELQKSWGITTELKHCPSCRQKNRTGLHTDSHNSINRQMYSAICAECGQNALVPFKPLSGRRIYCSDCYQKVRLHR